MSLVSQLLPAAILATGAIASYTIGTPRPTPLVRPLTETMPRSFLGAPSTDVVLGAEEVRASGVSDYINRAYTIGGVAPVELYVGYHDTQRGDKRMHSPSLCLPGSGWNPMDARVVEIPAAGRRYSVNRYVLQKAGRYIVVYYWFQGRGRVTAGQTELKLNAFKDALLEHRDEEALVRVIVPVGQARLTQPIGATGLLPDSVATQLASAAIPAVSAALPPAP